jgi:sulfatase modifying factor 1
MYPRPLLGLFAFAQLLTLQVLAEEPAIFVNSIGIELRRVEPGRFLRGSADGEWDEKPVHRVIVARAFHLATHEVTNAQFEKFQPAHRIHRGMRGLSAGDDDAVVNVSWEQAAAYCRWLARKEGKPYRLPTEAEWEYACRAGTTTAFVTGDDLPAALQKNQKSNWQPAPVSLRVGQGPANPWGFHDLHGNVEEWCADWYGPYVAGEQTDPTGRTAGLFRVTRGGSHNTEVRYLRSANRQGTLPQDRNWLIGFRVALGDAPTTAPLPAEPPGAWGRQVSPVPHRWPEPSATPRFEKPIRYVHIPPGANGPLYAKHNHQPSVTWCDNGDLLAIWFSTNSEFGRELTVVASRLRAGATVWEPADEFFKAPDRNMTGCSILNDGRGTLHHLNGLEAAGHWHNLALVHRTSRDHGATWSLPRIVSPHQPRNQVIGGSSVTAEGWLLQPCDANWDHNGGTALHISRDGGHTWSDGGAGSPTAHFAAGEKGGTIAGIHAGVVALRDGRLLAFGRGDNIPDETGRPRMPQSVSNDGGQTWTFSASPWPTLHGGQRLVLLRLREGPLLLCSFSDSSRDLKAPTGLRFTDRTGTDYTGYGAFAAVSFDEGATWPVRKLLTPGGSPEIYDGGAWTGKFTMDATRAEPKGYLAATQTPDGMIHFISSALHYRFNLAWLKEPAPPPSSGP